MEEEESKTEDCLSLWSGKGLLYPSANFCRATSYVTSLLNPLFHLCIVCTTCITLGLTHACNLANRVSGVNKYIFHMGHPSGFEDTVSLDVSLKMLSAVYLTPIFCLCLVYTVQPLDNDFHYLCKHPQL